VFICSRLLLSVFFFFFAFKADGRIQPVMGRVPYRLTTLFVPLVALPLAAAFASIHPSFALVRGFQPGFVAPTLSRKVLRTRQPQLRMNLFQVFNGMRGGGSAGSSASPSLLPSAFHDAAPSWDSLEAMAKATSAGTRLYAEQTARAAGSGPAHCKNKIRLFGKAEKDVRVVLYRDHAAWCPYCQKVWLLLEEKRIPYRIEHINMRSYGEKPDWFLEKMPSGMLPVVEIDGTMVTESIRIMQVLDQLDDTIPMLPRGDKEVNLACSTGTKISKFRY
jgi:glutaredoxin